MGTVGEEGSSMSSYKVTWEIDIEANNPLDAAIRAQEIQRDPASTATIYMVRNTKNGALFQVDPAEPMHTLKVLKL